MENTQFLGKNGLTGTSANHIANIAKEMYEALEASLDGVRLVSKDFTLAAGGQTYRLESESTRGDLAAITSSLKEISSLKSLIAWLREGIKAKEYLCSAEAEAKWINARIEEGCESLREPDSLKSVTFEKVLASEPADRQARYFALEAKCATLGKYVHPDGHLAVARKEFFDRLKNPTTVQGVGQHAEIYTYSTSFSTDEVDGLFFEIQQEYRSLQAEFNSLKGELEAKVSDARRRQLREVKEARKAWQAAREEALLERSAEVKALKIIIPDALRDIYNKVAAKAGAR